MGNLPGSLRDVRMALAVFGAQAALIYGVLLVPQDFLKTHTHYVYLAHYLLFLPFLFNARDRVAFLFSPSFLVVSYICISFTIGGFAFAHGYVLSPRDLADFGRWEHFRAVTFYFMMCNLCAMFAYFLARRRWPDSSPHPVRTSLQSYIPHLIIAGILLGVFSFVSVGLSFLGGTGNLGVVPQVFGALIILIVMAKTRWRYRFLVYIALLLVFGAAQYSNRRIVIVLIVSIVFVELVQLHDLRISLRGVFLCAAVLALAVVLQLTMTVARGVGGFKGSYWQAFREIRRFTTLKNVTTYSLKTTEGPAIFFHSNNGVEYVLDDRSLLCYGSTLVKALFLAVPRSIWPNKPQSIVHWYTYRWNPPFLERGGSACISLYTDYFWNFSMPGCLFALFIFYFFNRCFFLYLDRLRAGTVWPFIYLGVAHTCLLVYARSGALDGFATYVALAFILQWILFNSLLAMLHLNEHTQMLCAESLS